MKGFRRRAARRAKVPVEIKTLWYQDLLPYPMPVCVVSTIDAEEVPNVASCSSVFPWSAEAENPQVVIVTRESSRTSGNIRTAGSFALNFMTKDYLTDVVATGRPYAEGINKVDVVSFTLEPSETIPPPRVKEATYVLECALDQVVYPSPRQNNLIGNVQLAVIDQNLADLPKADRLRAMGLVTYFGWEDDRYFFCPPGRPTILPARPDLEKERTLPPLRWEPDAEEIMLRVPALFRRVARRSAESALRREGKDTVTAADLRRIRRKMGRE